MQVHVLYHEGPRTFHGTVNVNASEQKKIQSKEIGPLNVQQFQHYPL